MAHRDVFEQNAKCTERDRSVQWLKGFNQPRDLGCTGADDVPWYWTSNTLLTDVANEAAAAARSFVECSDTCAGYNGNNVCDDGGYGSDTNICTPGTDCTDCRQRSAQILLVSIAGYTGRDPGLRANVKMPDGGPSAHARTQSDSCWHPVDGTRQSGASAGNGVCEDGGRQHRRTDQGTLIAYDAFQPAVGWHTCAYGSDVSDCGVRTDPRPVFVNYACTDTCSKALNGICDDRSMWKHPFTNPPNRDGSTNYYDFNGLECAFGTDCSDCGRTNSPVMTDTVYMGGSLSTCVHPLTGEPQTNNGICKSLLLRTTRPRL